LASNINTVSYYPYVNRQTNRFSALQ